MRVGWWWWSHGGVELGFGFGLVRSWVKGGNWDWWRRRRWWRDGSGGEWWRFDCLRERRRGGDDVLSFFSQFSLSGMGTSVVWFSSSEE